MGSDAPCVVPSPSLGYLLESIFKELEYDCGRALPTSALDFDGLAIWLSLQELLLLIPRGIVIKGYADLPPICENEQGKRARCRLTLRMVLLPLSPGISWSRLRHTVAAAGGTLSDVVKLTQYFRDLR